MKKYKLDIYFAQWIERRVEANSREEAEQMGYKIAQDAVEAKLLNPDCIANEIPFALDPNMGKDHV